MDDRLFRMFILCRRSCNDRLSENGRLNQFLSSKQLKQYHAKQTIFPSLTRCTVFSTLVVTSTQVIWRFQGDALTARSHKCNKRRDFLIGKDIKQGEVKGSTYHRLHLKRAPLSNDSPDSNSVKRWKRGCKGEPGVCVCTQVRERETESTLGLGSEHHHRSHGVRGRTTVWIGPQLITGCKHTPWDPLDSPVN